MPGRGCGWSWAKLDDGEPEEENSPNGKAEAPPSLELPTPVPLVPRWSSLPEACLQEPVAPLPDVMCWARKEASNGISTPVRTLEGVLEGESPVEPDSIDVGTNVCNFFNLLEGSFRDPKTETGGLKRVGGKWG